MLHEFITDNRDAIIARTRERVTSRSWPSVSTHELDNGVPMFLTQISETLRLEGTATPFPADAIGSSATQHGGELLGAGFNVSQVVHDYGDICQAITAVAGEKGAEITVAEFKTLNASLDTAIAEAVTEHARISAQTRAADDVEHLGQAVHDLRDNLNTSILAFHALKRGDVAINGSTGAVLGRSLMSQQTLIDRILSEVRLAAGKQRRERLQVVTLVDEIAATGMLHSEYRRIQFIVEPVGPGLSVDGDPQLLMSAVMNVVHNAFKYTPTGGHVRLRTKAGNGRVVIEVEDECGGIPAHKGDLFRAFGDRRGVDRSGLGLGLSIARQAITAHGGEINVRNLPGKGCVFTIALPFAAETP